MPDDVLVSDRTLQGSPGGPYWRLQGTVTTSPEEVARMKAAWAKVHRALYKEITQRVILRKDLQCLT